MRNNNQFDSFKDVHVLVVAASTFTRAIKYNSNPDEKNDPQKAWSSFYYVDKKNLDQTETCEYRGLYQLDPVPQCIENEFDQTITDIVILETEATTKPEPLLITPEEHEITDGNYPEYTAVEFFKERMKFLLRKGGDLRFHDVSIDEMKPQKTLVDVLMKIQDLHRECRNRNGDWKLWFDMHGGFRDVSTVLGTAVKMLSVGKGIPDSDQSDRTEIIDTDGLISVLYGSSKEPNRIVDQTAFYFAESAAALKQFLDYGQYLAHKFAPYTGDDSYAFVSYRHDEAFLLSVRNVFAKFADHHIRFWYDRGIGYREDWTEALEMRNKKAAVFVGLLTNSYFESTECWKELIQAIADKRNCHDCVHFILLENNIDFQKKIFETFRNNQEIQQLAKEMQVTETDLAFFFESGRGKENFNWLKWYEFMDSEANISGETPDSPELNRPFQMIAELLQNNNGEQVKS